MIADKNEIDGILSSALKKKIFTACAVGISRLRAEQIDALDIFQGTTEVSGGSTIDGGTFFDLASLTKPLVTVLSLLALIKEGRVHLEEELPSLLPSPVPEDKRYIRLAHLVGHRSGLPAHRQYYKLKHRIESEELTDWILREPLASRPGTTYLYSDLDYMLLGRIISHKAGMTLAQYWQERIAFPLGLAADTHAFCGIESKKKNFAATGTCPWSGKDLRGLVHDDNCRATAALQGHAGLFATLRGTRSLCEDILLNIEGFRKNTFYKSEDLRSLVRPTEVGHWALGFDVPSGARPSSGSRFSRRTIGHLGFTGTSFWIDLEKHVIVVLLTNRVIYGEDSRGIREMRPLLHDAVIRALAAG